MIKTMIVSGLSNRGRCIFTPRGIILVTPRKCYVAPERAYYSILPLYLPSPRPIAPCLTEVRHV